MTRDDLVIVGVEHQYRSVPYLRGVHRGVGDLQGLSGLTIERAEPVGIRHPGRTGDDDGGGSDAIVVGDQRDAEEATH